MKRDDIPPPDDGPTLRVPPHSLEAEQAVLGGLLVDSAAFDRVGDLVAVADFFRIEHREIFGVISELALANKPADSVTVFETLKVRSKAEQAGGMAYINELASSSTGPHNLRAYAEIVRRKAFERSLIAAASDAETCAWRSDLQPTEKLDRIATSFAALERQCVTKAPRSIVDIAIERTDHYTALEQGEVIPGWPTGLPTLDRMLNGGLAPGRLYVLAARPSVGKSSFSQSIALHLAANGLPALFLSQEMSAAELADRAVANTGRVSYTALLSGRMAHEDWSRASDALEHLSRTALLIDDQPALRLSDIRAKARQVKGLKVLVIDYLQLCATDLVRENRNSQIEEISRGLKALAKQLDIAVIALSQLNRAVETRSSRRPTLADLRDSGAIEQDADTVMFLWPARDLSEGHKLIGCEIAKNRAGRCGQFALDFEGDLQRWVESTVPLELSQPAQGRKAFE